ncbi:protein kinase [Nocardia sp. NPDC059240]|uniref:protein kinase domain-containing protein n=1 Tax=Nocardia sp. NPDC059240 TaxID=3346786 RepID=UPI0036BA4155
MRPGIGPGGIFAGFRIVRWLGAGGMGEVFLAHDRTLPRHVALKVLTEQAGRDAELRARFLREADIVARLDHPNIVTVHARGEEHGRLWIAMGFVDGTDVERALNHGPLDPGRALRILTATADALDCAHDARVLHRDVKPANILLTSGPRERVVLTDFGIAKSVEESSSLTQKGDVLASFHYSAPERLDGTTSGDRASDIYSLGCTLFHILTGRRPFDDTGIAQLIYAHMYQPVPSARAANPVLPAALDAVIARALAKNPADRYRTCEELAAAAAAAFTAPAPPVTVLNTGPAVHLVDPAGPLPTISAAITAAAPGDTILISPGVYREALTLDKVLRLTTSGPRDAVVISAGDRDTITCTVAGGTLESLTIVQDGQGACVSVHDGGDPTVRDCVIRGGGSGISVFDGGRGTFERNEIHGTDNWRKRATVPVVVRSGANPTLRANTIRTGDYIGIRITEGATGLFDSNTIHFGDGASDTDWPAVCIESGARPTVVGNTIHDPDQRRNGRPEGVMGSPFGIVYIADETTGGLLERNIVHAHGDTVAVVVKYGAAPTLRHNTIRGGSIGILMDGEHTGGLFEENQLTGIREAAVRITRHAAPTLRGNIIRDNSGHGVHVASGETGG